MSNATNTGIVEELIGNDNFIDQLNDYWATRTDSGGMALDDDFEKAFDNWLQCLDESEIIHFGKKFNFIKN